MTPLPGPRRGRSGRTRYLEVSDLGSESEVVFSAISGFARFNEASGTSARKEQTYNPVETKHPQGTRQYSTFVRVVRLFPIAHRPGNIAL